MKLTEKLIDKMYAGWMSKVIGVRLGAPIEGWTYDRILENYGDIDGYVQEFQNFAADDDTNVPIYFIRAMENYPEKQKLEPSDVADALLNYAPYEHGFFWWGGYGMSTEHTAYQNLMNGIPAPRSGSVEQNGATVAEQIGGQIFIDTWGLICPGNPDLAAKLAEAAASVTHGRNGVYGGIFIACCIAYAYIENDIRKIIDKALSYIPADCEYTRAVRAVEAYYLEHPENWRKCYEYIYHNFGYDRYPGNCHIIPNASVMILSLLYGEGDFDDTINICNMCGWDTDCNVGNVATIMGVRGGTEVIHYQKWRAPINDLLICSGVMGDLNILNIPQCVDYLLRMAENTGACELSENWKEIVHRGTDCCHFEYEGSTHCMRGRAVKPDGDSTDGTVFLTNTREQAATGEHSLKIQAVLTEETQAEVYHKTYYFPQEFDDSRYDPFFSSLLYPGQSVHAKVRGMEGQTVTARLFVRDSRQNLRILGEAVTLSDTWKDLKLQIPADEGLRLVDEAGILFSGEAEIDCYLDDFYWDGKAQVKIEFAHETLDRWPGTGIPHFEVSQLARWKGITYLEEGKVHLTGTDWAATYTGRHDWKDYEMEADITPLMGAYHLVNVCVQGAMRSYAFGLYGENRLALLKNVNGYQILETFEFAWEMGQTYHIRITTEENRLRAFVDGALMVEYADEKAPYLEGCIGLTTLEGSHLACSSMSLVQK